MLPAPQHSKHTVLTPHRLQDPQQHFMLKAFAIIYNVSLFGVAGAAVGNSDLSLSICLMGDGAVQQHVLDPTTG
jgi:hypothetical protein